jgi:hypothetical protein
MRPKGEFAAPQQQQEGGREDGGAKIVNQILPVITTPRALSLTRLGPSCNASGTLAAVLATVTRELRSERVEGRKRSPASHGEENRLHPEREEADRQSPRRRGDELYHKRAPVRPYRVERETNAVGTDAEERHIRERHGARITRNRS